MQIGKRFRFIPELTDTEKQFQTLLLNEDCDGLRNSFSDRPLTEIEQKIYMKYIFDAVSGKVKPKDPEWLNQCVNSK